ncbi:hypothetical protein Lalb_Chr00c16g0404941 [Lupinus albus]|uniref:Uncharacterized protein n=1 Tax=Lupinus albus TaxID=3870 RepID=A0A6A4MWB9_LUPAL|nr:hypothetical protein Lalb_Chr00c16g0404941 [Lupinus albus]
MLSPWLEWLLHQATVIKICWIGLFCRHWRLNFVLKGQGLNASIFEYLVHEEYDTFIELSLKQETIIVILLFGFFCLTNLFDFLY